MIGRPRTACVPTVSNKDAAVSVFVTMHRPYTPRGRASSPSSERYGSESKTSWISLLRAREAIFYFIF